MAGMNDFLPDVKKSDIEKALNDPDWQDDVANAILFALTHIDPEANISPEEISLSITNYNITRKLHFLYKEKLKPLPKEIYWDSKTTQREAFDSLEAFVAYFDLARPDLKKAKVNFIIDDDIIRIKLNGWCERIKNHFDNNIKIQCKKLKAKNKYSITLS